MCITNQGDDAGNKKVFHCPNCGKEWDTEKFNACECGATIERSLSKEEGKDEKDLEQSRIDYYENKIDMLNRVHSQEIERLKEKIKQYERDMESNKRP